MGEGWEKKWRSDGSGHGGEGTDGVKGGHRRANEKSWAKKTRAKAEKIAAVAEQWRKTLALILSPWLSLLFSLCSY